MNIKSTSSDWVKFLGLSAGQAHRLTPVGLIDWIDEGLPISALENVSNTIAPRDKRFKYLICSKSALSRRASKPTRTTLSPMAGTRTVRLANVWGAAVDVWKDDESARNFLRRPHPLLEGRKPLDLVLKSEMGAQMVKDILGELKYGSAA